jgi:arsenate reductase
MIKIYHNPSCKKSRAGLQHLKESGHAFTVVEYLKNPLTEKEVEILLVKLNLSPSAIIRTQEEYYKKNLKGKKFEDHELVSMIVQHPKLMKRPVVERNYKAVIGDPVENIATLLT